MLKSETGNAVDVSNETQQLLLAALRPHIQEQLRLVFERYESRLVEQGVSLTSLVEVRRARRMLVDRFLQHWAARCERQHVDFQVGTAASVAYARTYLYLCSADESLRTLHEECQNELFVLMSTWTAMTGEPVQLDTCPLLPYTLAKLFFLLLPELPLTLTMREELGRAFLSRLPAFQHMVFMAATALWARAGLRVDSAPMSVTSEWSVPPLVPFPSPSTKAAALVVPAEWRESVLLIADDIARAALAGDVDDVMAQLGACRHTVLFTWLAEQLQALEDVPDGRHSLMLLAGPLLAASVMPCFADAAHPARRVLDEWMQWALGWEWTDEESLALNPVAMHCIQEAHHLSSWLVHAGEEGLSSLDAGCWLSLLDYLMALRRQTYQDSSVSVSSAKLALQALDARVEVETLLRDRGLSFGLLPSVVVDILSNEWTALLMSIHWHEGAASDAWLNAISVADELLLSVQPIMDRQSRMQVMQRVPHLLKQLRTGLESLNVDRTKYGDYLEQLEQVHLALMQNRPLQEPLVSWPETVVMPPVEEAFEVGQWFRELSGVRWRVVFSDELCTVMVDTGTAGVACCSTALLQSQLFDGDLVTMPALRGVLAPTA